MISIVPFGAVPKTLLDFLREELAFRFGTEVRVAVVSLALPFIRNRRNSPGRISVSGRGS